MRSFRPTAFKLLRYFWISCIFWWNRLVTRDYCVSSTWLLLSQACVFYVLWDASGLQYTSFHWLPQLLSCQFLNHFWFRCIWIFRPTTLTSRQLIICGRFSCVFQQWFHVIPLHKPSSIYEWKHTSSIQSKQWHWYCDGYLGGFAYFHSRGFAACMQACA